MFHSGKFDVAAGSQTKDKNCSDIMNFEKVKLAAVKSCNANNCTTMLDILCTV